MKMLTQRVRWIFDGVIFSVLMCGFVMTPIVLAAAGAIVSPNQWAWNDVIGWVNFNPSLNPAPVVVSDNALTGMIGSGVGFMFLDCNTYTQQASLPAGKTCSNYPGWNIQKNAGLLSGYAWNDAIGWVSFSCSDGNNCPVSDYRVSIDGAGDFHGFAWNDVIGWLSFNSEAAFPAYKVHTDWTPTVTRGDLESNVFNAGSAVQLNSILWRGSTNGGTVKFQVASATSHGGPWSFVGPNGSTSSYYAGLPEQPMTLTAADHHNKQFFRYKIYLEKTSTSPIVEDVIINWSR